MTIQRLPDGSLNPQWVKDRQGKLGASKIDCILDPRTGDAKEGRKKGEPSEMRKTLAKQLAAERYAGHSCGYVNPNNPDIKRGNDMEPVAIAEYELKRGIFMRPAMWVEHPELPFSGSTPDGFAPDGGLVQVKAPRLDNYVALVLGEEIPTDYLAQLVWEQAVTRAPYSDLILFCDEMPEGKKMWIKRYEAPNNLIEAYEEQVALFLQEVERIFDILSTTEFA
jgi:hypothetical protein